MMERTRPKGSKTVDPVTGKRLLNVCWLQASLGSFTLELRLREQALSAIHALGAGQYQGTLIAGIALAWICGTLPGRSLCLRASALTWGIWLLAVSLTWLALPSLGLSLATLFARDAVRLLSLSLLAALLALLCAAWTRQERAWPRVAEGTLQLSNLGGMLFGLVLTWLAPDVAGILGIALLLPLLLVDLWPAARCPLPRPVRHRSLPPARPVYGHTQRPLQARWNSAVRARSGRWWWFRLDQRGQLSLTLLASCGTIILTSVWSVVRTLYAWNLARSHALATLLWLQCGQLCAFLLGALALRGRQSRRLLGAPHHRIAPALRQPALLLGRGALPAGAVALAALGNPWLQTPWFLGLTLTGFTLGLAAWHRIHPRLLSSLAPELSEGRRHLPWTLPPATWAEDLAAQRVARDEQARRFVSRRETAILMSTVLLTGTLSDQWGIGPVLVLAGGTLMAAIGLASLTGKRGARQLAAASARDQQSRPACEPSSTLHAGPAATGGRGSGSPVPRPPIRKREMMSASSEQPIRIGTPQPLGRSWLGRADYQPPQCHRVEFQYRIRRSAGHPAKGADCHPHPGETGGRAGGSRAARCKQGKEKATPGAAE